MGCLAPLLEGPATTLSLSSESLELDTARFTFFEGGGLADEDEGSDAADISVGFWAPLGKSEPDVDRSTTLPFTGAGTEIIGSTEDRAGLISLRCSSSESSVAESSSGFVLDGPAWGIADDRSFNLVPANPNQSCT